MNNTNDVPTAASIGTVPMAKYVEKNSAADNIYNFAEKIINQKSIDKFLKQPIYIQMVYLLMACAMFYKVLDFVSVHSMYFIVLTIAYSVYNKEDEPYLNWFGRTRF